MIVGGGSDYTLFQLGHVSVTVGKRLTPSYQVGISLAVEAIHLVTGDRARDYGHPAKNHTGTASLWSQISGKTLTAYDVCKMQIGTKLSRDAHSPKRDNLVDTIGWAMNAVIARAGHDGDLE